MAATALISLFVILSGFHEQENKPVQTNSHRGDNKLSEFDFTLLYNAPFADIAVYSFIIQGFKMRVHESK